MRLLDTETVQFVDNLDPETTVFAILSHTWDKVDKEQTYEELKKIQQHYIPESQVPPSAPDGLNGITSSSTEQEGGSSRSLPLLSSQLDPTSVAAPATAPQKPSKSWFLSRKTIQDDPKLSLKIRDACRIAREHGYRYIWIDSCCIDKSSSSELSEAINSMYRWDGLAAVCYAYLADVPTGKDNQIVHPRFRRSRWFRRGWTLQELIAPRQVEFLSKDWVSIGSKRTLVDLVENVTRISRKALLHSKPLDAFSVAQRLSWAANRETSREEDKAYSLLGIFNINLPTLYGEGNRAFRRLQEQIIQCIPDQSIFAWGDVYSKSRLIDTYRHWIPPHPIPYDPPQHLFPLSPDSFKNCDRTVNIPEMPIEYTPTPYGIRTQFRMIPLTQDLLLHDILPTASGNEDGHGHYPLYPPAAWTDYQWYLAILGCEHTEHPGHLLGRVCYILPGPKSGVEFVHTGFVDGPVLQRRDYQYFPDLFPLSPHLLQHPQSELRTVYIPHPDRPALNSRVLWQPYTAIKLVLLRDTCDALRVQGYSADLREPDPDHATSTHSLTLTHYDHTITVEFQYTLEDGGTRFTIDAEIEILRSHPVQLHPLRVHPLQGSTPAANRETHYTASWFGYVPWTTELGQRRICPNEAGAGPLTVDLERDFTGSGIYILRINTQSDVLPPSSAIESPVDRLGEAVGSVRLEDVESPSGENKELGDAGRENREETSGRQEVVGDEARSSWINRFGSSIRSRFKLGGKRDSVGRGSSLGGREIQL